MSHHMITYPEDLAMKGITTDEKDSLLIEYEDDDTVIR